MRSTLIICLFVLFNATPVHADARCQITADELYSQFKQYREQLNEAPRFDSLSKFFSANFNEYFTDKMRSASSELIRQRYLAQYWDNLNAARDVVIVFDYSLQCDGQRATLNLISILDNTQARVGQQIRLWQVAIKYVQARQEWKIDSITYEELNHSNSKSYQANEIINNFLNIR